MVMKRDCWTHKSTLLRTTFIAVFPWLGSRASSYLLSASATPVPFYWRFVYHTKNRALVSTVFLCLFIYFYIWISVYLYTCISLEFPVEIFLALPEKGETPNFILIHINSFWYTFDILLIIVYFHFDTLRCSIVQSQHSISKWSFSLILVNIYLLTFVYFWWLMLIKIIIDKAFRMG